MLQSLEGMPCTLQTLFYTTKGKLALAGFLRVLKYVLWSGYRRIGRKKIRKIEKIRKIKKIEKIEKIEKIKKIDKRVST